MKNHHCVGYRDTFKTYSTYYFMNGYLTLLLMTLGQCIKKEYCSTEPVR